MSLSLEAMYTSPTAGFGIAATPTQRAVLRVIEGRALGDLARDPDVIEAFGGAEAVASLPATAPREFDLLSPIRTGKSQIAACRALHASQTVDVSHLSHGEVPRVSVLSLDLDKADVVLHDHLIGTIEQRPVLRRLLIGTPTADSILVRHPSGRPIEIKVVAGARAGGSIVARWSAGVIFDEFTRMFGAGEAVVNFSDARQGALNRLLDGATLLNIGSPWSPMSPAYSRFVEHYGKPSDDLVVVRAAGASMHPRWWTPARVAKSEHAEAYAEFFDPSETYYSAAEIKRATRAEPLVLPPSTRPRKYMVGLDPATRRNAFTMVLLAAYLDENATAKYEVVMAREWQGTPSRPLSPWETFAEIRRLIAPYGNPLVVSDQHSGDSNVDICSRQGLKLIIQPITAQNRNQLFEALKGTLVTGTMQLAPDRTLASDLSSVRRKLTVTGIQYDLPRSGGGRHADYVTALCLALSCMGDTSQARAAAAEAWRMQRLGYVGEFMAGEISMADIEAAQRLADVRRIQEARWTAQPVYERGRQQADQLLNRLGSPAGSAYRPPPDETPEAKAEREDLERRVQRRLTRTGDL